MQTAEIQEIRQLARQFAEAELRPHTEKWDHDAALDPRALEQLAELGFFGMLIPEANGGMEFDRATYVSVLEELAWGEPSVALTVAVTSYVADLVVRHGSAAQKTRWLEAMASGAVIASVALSEDDVGRDATATNLQATRAGDGWMLSGEQHWVINGRTAGLALVAARTGPNESGVSVFLVPTDTAGYQVGEREQTMGLRAQEIVSVKLTDVRLDGDALLREVGGSEVLSYGLAAIATGIAQAALEHAIGYADVREQFQTKLRDFEGIQFKLADMATRVEATRALLQQVTAETSAVHAAMSKLFAAETAMWVTTQAVQIYGGYGYMRDYPVEKLMREAKATEILAGASDIQRVLIARELYT